MEVKYLKTDFNVNKAYYINLTLIYIFYLTLVEGRQVLLKVISQIVDKY